MTIPWLKILKYGLPAIVLGLAIWWVYSTGSKHGRAEIQTKWDTQKKHDQEMIEKEKKKIAQDEQTHRAKDREIASELADLKQDYADDIARIRGDAALRLRDHEERAALYRSQAETGSVERANLASHAAQLDRALSEGIELVDELQATLELRDGQIGQLASQIHNDRQLISGQSNTDGNDAAHAQ